MPLPEMTHAIAFTGERQTEYIPWPCDASPLGPNEIAGPTVATLVSPGTELNSFFDKGTEPRVVGYTAVMRVEECGSSVSDLAPGDLCFVMGPHIGRQRVPRINAVPLPDGLSPHTALFCRLMGVSWSTLVTTTARPPSRVLVTGLGPVGNLAAQIFSAAGYEVTAIDPVEARRELALKCGLKDIRASAPHDDPALARKFALAVECSGHEAAVLDACRLVRQRGEVALVGVPWRQRTEISAWEILYEVFHHYVVLRSGWEWELPVQEAAFSPGSILGNLAGALRWLAEGRVHVEDLYSVASPKEGQRVYSDLEAQRGTPTVAFDWTKNGQ